MAASSPLPDGREGYHTMRHITCDMTLVCSRVLYSSGDVKVVRDSIISHELFHLFGFAHSRTPNERGNLHPYQNPEGEGVAMSNPLTHGTDPPDLGVTFEDVDALRCIFPKR